MGNVSAWRSSLRRIEFQHIPERRDHVQTLGHIAACLHASNILTYSDSFKNCSITHTVYTYCIVHKCTTRVDFYLLPNSEKRMGSFGLRALWRTLVNFMELKRAPNNTRAICAHKAYSCLLRKRCYALSVLKAIEVL